MRLLLLTGANLLKRMLLLLCLLLGCANAMTLTNSHLSPKNSSRPRRSSTRFIILHTTEGSAKGSLSKLRRRGECHYCVDKDGKIYRIIKHRRVAYHAGRSMWNGVTNLDGRSIGIEVVGYHNRDVTGAQYVALKELIAELQRIYRISDRNVLTHSMVAYGKPNRWHRRSHRGRKRCGMVFALHNVRQRLGLTAHPTHDPDIAAGRLVQADSKLGRILYGPPSVQNAAIKTYGTTLSNIIAPGRTAWDIARDRYRSAETLYIFPKGTRKRGDEIKNFRALPPGTKVLLSGTQADNAKEELQQIGKHGDTAMDIAGDEWDDPQTVYIIKRGKRVDVKFGASLPEKDAKSLPKGTRILVGYRRAGTVTMATPAFAICGTHWNRAETHYLFPDGKLLAGNRVNETAIPANAVVFVQD